MVRKKKKVEKLPASIDIECFYCRRPFKNDEGLHTHQRSKHFRCPLCPKTCLHVPSLVQHHKLVHGKDLESIPGADPDRQVRNKAVVGMHGYAIALAMSTAGVGSFEDEAGIANDNPQEGDIAAQQGQQGAYAAVPEYKGPVPSQMPVVGAMMYTSQQQGNTGVTPNPPWANATGGGNTTNGWSGNALISQNMKMNATNPASLQQQQMLLQLQQQQQQQQQMAMLNNNNSSSNINNINNRNNAMNVGQPQQIYPNNNSLGNMNMNMNNGNTNGYFNNNNNINSMGGGNAAAMYPQMQQPQQQQPVLWGAYPFAAGSAQYQAAYGGGQQVVQQRLSAAGVVPPKNSGLYQAANARGGIVNSHIPSMHPYVHMTTPVQNPPVSNIAPMINNINPSSSGVDFGKLPSTVFASASAPVSAQGTPSAITGNCVAASNSDEVFIYKDSLVSYEEKRALLPRYRTPRKKNSANDDNNSNNDNDNSNKKDNDEIGNSNGNNGNEKKNGSDGDGNADDKSIGGSNDGTSDEGRDQEPEEK